MYSKWTARTILLIVAFLSLQASAKAQFQPIEDLGPVHSVRTTITVNHGDYIAGGDGSGYCRSTGSSAAEQQLTRLAAAEIVSNVGLTGTVGVLAANFLTQLFRDEISQSGGTMKEWLEGFGAVDSFAACGNVALAIPKNKVTRSIEVFASDANNGWQMSPCPANPINHRFICNVGWSEWVFAQNGRVVTGIFKNWSGDRTRRASMVISYYEKTPKAWENQ